MRKKILSALVAGGFLAVSSSAFGAPVQPTVSITAITGSEVDQISVMPIVHESDGTYEIGGDQGWNSPANSEFQISLNGLIDPDPLMTFGFSVTDFGAPTTFTFSFSTPIAPTGSPNQVRASLGGSFTDADGDGGSIALAPGFSNVMVSTVGSPTTPLGVDVGGAMSFPASTTTLYGPFVAGFIAGPVPATTWNNLSSSVNFTLSGHGDVFSGTGRVDIETPEPATLSVLALAALPALLRRRRRTE